MLQRASHETFEQFRDEARPRRADRGKQRLQRFYRRFHRVRVVRIARDGARGAQREIHDRLHQLLITIFRRLRTRAPTSSALIALP